MTTIQTYPHATRQLHMTASDALASLRLDGPALAADATASARAALAPLLREGRFRRPAGPRLETEVVLSGLVALRVTWNRNDADRWPPSSTFATRPTSRWWRSDEEETGWPTATIDVVVEPRAQGCRLAALSTRPPGTDLSTNRIDRHLRDRIARTAIEGFLTALAAAVMSSYPTTMASTKSSRAAAVTMPAMVATSPPLGVWTSSSR